MTKKSSAPQLKRYDIKKLQKAIKFPKPVELESIGLKFSLWGIKMDDSWIWSIDLKFEDVFETLLTSYNMVIVRNFRNYEKTLESYLEKLDDKQLTLDDFHSQKGINIFNNMNDTIKDWNSLNFVQNITGTLKKYDFKTKAREMTFFIRAVDVDFFKNEFNFWSEYLMFLEPTVATFSEEKKQTIAVPKVIYDTLDFHWDKLDQDDFLI